MAVVPDTVFVLITALVNSIGFFMLYNHVSATVVRDSSSTTISTSFSRTNDSASYVEQVSVSLPDRTNTAVATVTRPQYPQDRNHRQGIACEQHAIWDLLLSHESEAYHDRRTTSRPKSHTNDVERDRSQSFRPNVHCYVSRRRKSAHVALTMHQLATHLDIAAHEQYLRARKGAYEDSKAKRARTFGLSSPVAISQDTQAIYEAALEHLTISLRKLAAMENAQQGLAKRGDVRWHS